MSAAERILLIKQNDKAAKKELFDQYYGKLAAIANRYCKNQQQAEEVITVAFNNCFHKLETLQEPQNVDLDKFLVKAFIQECISFVRNVRSEYFVSSTVYATDKAAQNYDLFENNNETIDFNSLDNDILLKALQQLVPAQRLIFNLHVIDGFSLDESAALLEASAPTVKSNLEKARFNMQKNIEKSLKNTKS
jgi:RNA polymerase sigma-70 factor, ECF subfamily